MNGQQAGQSGSHSLLFFMWAGECEAGLNGAVAHKKKIFTECREEKLLREVLSHWVLQKTAHIQTASVNSEAGKIDPSNRKEQVKKMSLGSDLGADPNIFFLQILLFFPGKEFVELGHKTAWEIHLPLLVMTFNYLKRFHMGPLQCWMWWAINACSQPECFINRHTQVSKVILMRNRVATVRSEVRIIIMSAFLNIYIKKYIKNCKISFYSAIYEVTIVGYKLTLMKKLQMWDMKSQMQNKKSQLQ